MDTLKISSLESICSNFSIDPSQECITKISEIILINFIEQKKQFSKTSDSKKLNLVYYLNTLINKFLNAIEGYRHQEQFHQSKTNTNKMYKQLNQSKSREQDNYSRSPYNKPYSMLSTEESERNINQKNSLNNSKIELKSADSNYSQIFNNIETNKLTYCFNKFSETKDNSNIAKKLDMNNQTQEIDDNKFVDQNHINNGINSKLSFSNIINIAILISQILLSIIMLNCLYDNNSKIINIKDLIENSLNLSSVPSLRLFRAENDDKPLNYSELIINYSIIISIISILQYAIINQRKNTRKFNQQQSQVYHAKKFNSNVANIKSNKDEVNNKVKESMQRQIINKFKFSKEK